MAHNLIASDRVEGTPVCRPTGEQIGVIQRLMIDKLSGQIAYAVLSFGGFLGFGQKHFPVPWRSLKYNPKHGAYEFEVTEEQLRAAPSFAPGEEFDWAIGPMKFKSSSVIIPFITGGSSLTVPG